MGPGDENCFVVILRDPFFVQKNSTPLHTACALGDPTSAALVVQLLLDLGVSINGSDRGGQTPLLIACSHGFVSGVKLLLQNGATVNEVTLFNNNFTWIFVDDNQKMEWVF